MYCVPVRPPAKNCLTLKDKNKMPNSVNVGVWSGLREISMNLVDRKSIEQKMEEAIKNKLKYTSKVLSRNKLEYLNKNKIGTARVESLSQQIEGKSSRNPNTVKYIMDINVRNVEREIKTLKAQIFTLDKDIKRILHSGWRREMYVRLCKTQTSKAWENGTKSNAKSREHLVNKYSNTKKDLVVSEGTIRVNIEEDMTEEQRQNFVDQMDEPVCLGLSITPEEKAFLQLPQNLTDHVEFNRIKALVDTAVMGTKYRMTVKDRIDDDITEEEINKRTAEQKHSDSLDKALLTQVYDANLNEATFARMRVTSLKTCRRVTIPPPLPEKEEAKIQSVLTAIEEAINKESARNKKLRIRPSTLSKKEQTGLKMLRKRTKKGEAAIVATDKSGKMSALSKSVYDSKILEHTHMDKIITHQDVAKLETVLSATASSMARVLQIGEAWGQSDRVQSAVKSELTSVPPLAMLLKDHKEGSDKPIRPLCRSADSPNGVLSDLTAKVMQIVAKDINSKQLTKVCSTEQVCAILEDINSKTPENLDCLTQCGPIEQGFLAQHQIDIHPQHVPEMVVGSMDVKALYPSLDIEHSVQIIKEQMVASDVQFDTNVSVMALHLTATMTELEIKNEGLTEVVHTRRYNMGCRPGITSKSVTGTELERIKYDSWVDPIREPTHVEKKLMFAIAISQSVQLVMKSHVYTNSDVIRLQSAGGAIGLGSTGEVADLVMLRHDKLLEKALIEAGIHIKGKSRYVDDENPVFRPTPYGAVWIDKKIQVVPDQIASDKLIPHDQRTFKIVQQIANSIWKHIQFTVEVPSLSPNGLIPMLDMQVGINQIGKITRQFYSKPVATPFTILARSAHPWQTKRSTLTQEGVRRLLNTSSNSSEMIRNTIMEQWDHKMNLSGYDKKFRSSVIKSAVQSYNSKVVIASEGGRPVYRPFGYQASDSDINKVIAAHTWYTGNAQIRNQAPLIIDPTPTGAMETEIKNILSNAARISDVCIKFCTRGGRKVSSKAKSDPFSSKKCERTNCTVCSVPNSNGGCRFSNIGYQLVCNPCKETDVEATYQGETAKSAFERGQQHQSDLKRKVLDTPMWKHAQLFHESDNKISFSLEVTSRFKKAMIRQEDEAIRIRESQSKICLNSKSEFHQPSNIRLVPASGNINLDQEGHTAPVIPPTMFNFNQHNRVDSPIVPMRTRSKGQVPLTDPIQMVQTTRAERNAVSRKPAKYAKNNAGDRVVPEVIPTVSTVQSGNSKGSSSRNVQKTKKHQKNNLSVKCVENTSKTGNTTSPKPLRRHRLSLSNVAEHNALGNEWLVISEWNMDANHSLNPSSDDNPTSNSSSSAGSPNNLGLTQYYEPVSPNTITQSTAATHSNVSNANTKSIHKTTSTHTKPSNMRQQGITTKSSANNTSLNVFPQTSQISQNPLTQYISTKSHIVASVSSKPAVPSVTTVSGKRRMAEYKPASPPSPPSHMNSQVVEAQVHFSETYQNTQSHQPNQETQEPVQGSWSSWNGENVTQSSNHTMPSTPLNSMQQNQAYERELFKRSDTQAMLDLFLMRLDEEERQEEIVRNAIQNPIKTISAYNAFKVLRSKQAPVTTLQQVSETLPVVNFTVPQVPKTKKVAKNPSKVPKNQQNTVKKSSKKVTKGA